ncbi:amidohydrolase family protein [Aggregicoccus sp. 17bor-14]|uniref:amidohydrolase family protein n=1 Tax=Myxococcaceae TaxID=31 RepID=UPI00129CA17A|nr:MULTISPECIES: amidohydrolase family protein [Myxococcaceae]MBF5042395.1 amidohydrolase family protein [Simulacricoccus sp. 17bor-14]MRI88167.1 amidohydrolase family protein [Aggregicoccus sp. 17bor-14]
MGTVLKGGVVVELEPATVERADLRIEGERIVERAPELQPGPGDEVIALSGKLVLPGLVSAHSRLHAHLARGLPQPQPPPDGYGAYQERVWWPYVSALDLDAVQAAAQAGALEALQSGTTCLFDLHSSPRAVGGSLVRVARALHEVGVRSVLSYAVTDAAGPQGREEGLEEAVTFARKARGRFRGQVGAGPLSYLADDALQALAHAVAMTGRGIHLPLAEDPLDEKLSQERYGAAPVSRLVGAGLLGPSSVLAHVGHLAWPELSQVLTTGAWVVHTPRSNMGHEVGYAPALKFGARASLGADTLGADLFAEAQTAYLRSREAGQPIDVLRYLANGHRLASQVFDLPVGPLRAGAAADLMVLDYRPSTPMAPENLAWHVVFGLSARHVEAVMVEGGWRVWARRPLSVNPDVVADQAREAAAHVWSRMQRPPPPT